MLKTRVIPCLLLKGRRLVKTVKFRRPSYVGDPINTVRIFNDKEVDELVFLDISATREGHPPELELIEDIASECFMPFAYGGGVRSLEDCRKVFGAGAEKVVLNSHGLDNPDVLREAAAMFGSQSIVVSIDVKRRLFAGQTVVGRGGRRAYSHKPVEWARCVESLGAGEILLTSVDRDGTFEGYDQELIASVSSSVGIPVVACGGAGSFEDLRRGKQAGASALAAGSLFVYQNRNRSVLINYPDKSEMKALLDE